MFFLTVCCCVVVNMSQETDKFIKNIVGYFSQYTVWAKHSVSMLIQDKVQKSSTLSYNTET